LAALKPQRERPCVIDENTVPHVIALANSGEERTPKLQPKRIRRTPVVHGDLQIRLFHCEPAKKSQLGRTVLRT
jgi:hypothetical protein